MTMEVEKMITVVEVMVKKDIMRRMDNQANKIGCGSDDQSNYSNIESGFDKIAGATISKEAWDILKKCSKEPTESSKCVSKLFVASWRA
jgi:hypothetical protein